MDPDTRISMNDQSPWWRKTTIYQIYPRSFLDTNRDGIGDLQGIIAKLDYLHDLGIETIWVSPFFSSPQRDFGYDISDYLSIAPEFGDLEDVDQLIEEVHRRDMRILFDLVLNHTSDQHPWFQSSRSSREDPKRDWYIWKDGNGSRPPNNWRSIVGGSGWHFDASTDQWYYASFLPFQPDLNYRNPQVVSQMMSIARHWLDKGVDGYRLDIFHCLFEDKEFRNNPWSTKLISKNSTAGFFQDFVYNLNQPETVQFAYQIRKLAESYPEPKLLLGEIFADLATQKEYLGRDQDGLHLIFLWDLLFPRPNAAYLQKILARYEDDYSHPYQPVLVYGNHDHQRLMSNIQGDTNMARLLAVLQLTARGVPVIYYGEEIGMSQISLPKQQWMDPVGQRYSWLPVFIPKLLKMGLTRDGCRAPMQWEAEENAGFTPPGLEPWLPVNTDFRQVNAATQQSQPDSLLNTYRQLLQIRASNPAIHSGEFELVSRDGNSQQLLAYKRCHDDQEIMILMNFSGKRLSISQQAKFDQMLFKSGEITQGEHGDIYLGPYAAAIIRI